MKAVRFHRCGGPEVLVWEDVPEPEIGPDQVLIRVAAAGVNFSDLMRRALGDHIFPRYIELKRREWDEYRIQVSEWEKERYLSAL